MISNVSQSSNKSMRKKEVNYFSADDEVLLPPRNVEARNAATLAAIKSFKVKNPFSAHMKIFPFSSRKV